MNGQNRVVYLIVANLGFTGEINPILVFQETIKRTKKYKKNNKN